ncbi:MAG TPA: hypothetical protein VNI20_13145 [Fimbriimonadaceae bacterium]|nr:hypothetical protein [Fimbriimonadaceae bacterium]
MRVRWKLWVITLVLVLLFLGLVELNDHPMVFFMNDAALSGEKTSIVHTTRASDPTIVAKINTTGVQV